MDGVIAEYFLGFLTILTVIWHRMFIAQFQRNRGRGYHNLLRRLFQRLPSHGDAGYAQACPYWLITSAGASAD